MLSYEEIYEIVKGKLSEKRFYHSECVVARCIEYAKIYGENMEKVKIAGIAHDLAKELKPEESITLAEKYGVELDNIEKINTPLIHAKLGAAIAKKEFGCLDDICESIRWHTTGKENMSLMEKIVFVADATGIDRHYEEAEKIYGIAKKNIHDAVEATLKSSMMDVLQKGMLMHPDSVKAYNYIIKENHNFSTNCGSN